MGTIALTLLLLGASRPGPDPVAATRVALARAKLEEAAKSRAALLPRETFLGHSTIIDVRLSPDGRSLSYLRRTGKGVDVMLRDVPGGVERRIASGARQPQTGWSGDGSRFWLADEQGVAVIGQSDASPKRIYKWDTKRNQRLWSLGNSQQLAIITETVTGQAAKKYRYLTLDSQGITRLLLEADLPLRSILLNAAGNLAFTVAFDGERYETVIREYRAGTPTELLRCSSLEDCRLVGYNGRQGTLWALSQHGEDRLVLKRWRNESRRWETVHSDPAAVADAGEVLWNGARETWLGISYHDGRRRWYGNGAENQALLGAIERQLPGANLQLSATNDGRLWLVRAQQSDHPLDRYYLYWPLQQRLQPLFTGNDSVSEHPPGVSMHPVTYRARDGALLHGYVLLPGGVAPAKAPLVAWLHGGPVSRTFDEYEGSMQLLANRGFAVFVPNFRESTGYGLQYTLSPKGDVGNGRVLSDIIDGLDFLLGEGIGDRNRQAVMGMSFGGYASLLALSHHPARFRFAFAGAPPTDYGWIKQWQAEHDSDALHPEGAPLSLQFPQLGFPYKDAVWRQKMERESPLVMVGALVAPAYIWAGAQDDHVPVKSVVNYVGEARRLRKPVALFIDPDGAHSPRTALGTEASLYLIELAAHRHLGSALSPVAPELEAFLKRNLRVDIEASWFK